MTYRTVFASLTIATYATWSSVVSAQPMDLYAPMPRDAAGVAQHQWSARPVLIFAPSDDAPGLEEQKRLFAAEADGLAERDIIVLTDTDTTAPSPLRQRLAPNGFAVVLVGKDGGVKLVSETPVTPETLFSTIDRMPMRQREMGS